MAKFEIYQDAAGDFRWRFQSNNGKILAVSCEGYNNRASTRLTIPDFASLAPLAGSGRTACNVIENRGSMPKALLKHRTWPAPSA